MITDIEVMEVTSRKQVVIELSFTRGSISITKDERQNTGKVRTHQQFI